MFQFVEGFANCRRNISEFRVLKLGIDRLLQFRGHHRHYHSGLDHTSLFSSYSI